MHSFRNRAVNKAVGYKTQNNTSTHREKEQRKNTK